MLINRLLDQASDFEAPILKAFGDAEDLIAHESVFMCEGFTSLGVGDFHNAF